VVETIISATQKGRRAVRGLTDDAARALVRAVSPVPTENVVGVGMGEKISSGRHTGVWAVKFFVRSKYPEAQLLADIACRSPLTVCLWTSRKPASSARSLPQRSSA
jgi:hypothetical protein